MSSSPIGKRNHLDVGNLPRLVIYLHPDRVSGDPTRLFGSRTREEGPFVGGHEIDAAKAVLLHDGPERSRSHCNEFVNDQRSKRVFVVKNGAIQFAVLGARLRAE